MKLVLNIYKTRNLDPSQIFKVSRTMFTPNSLGQPHFTLHRCQATSCLDLQKSAEAAVKEAKACKGENYFGNRESQEVLVLKFFSPK